MVTPIPTRSPTRLTASGPRLGPAGVQLELESHGLESHRHRDGHGDRCDNRQAAESKTKLTRK
jgi:hypothetical protein